MSAAQQSAMTIDEHLSATASTQQGGWARAFRTMGRVLTFRLRREDVDALDWRCVVVAMMAVWLAGVGRYWDTTEATVLQHLGVRSLVYALGLTAMLWVMVMPVANRFLKYWQMLTLIGMTAPLGFLYAIPVQWWMTEHDAVTANGLGLAFVATYRVALLAMIYRRAAGVHPAGVAVVTLIPLCIVSVVLGLMSLDRVIAQSMGGIQPDAPVEQFDAVVMNIGHVAFWMLPVLAIIYLVWAVRRHRYRDGDHRNDATESRPIKRASGAR